MKKLLPMLMVLLSCTNLSAQHFSEQSRASMFLSIGAVVGETKWQFTHGRLVSLQPGFAIGVGIPMGHGFSVSDGRITPSIEFSHGESGTGLVDNSDDPFISRYNPSYTAETNIARSTTMIWVTVLTENTFTPFVRAGIGASYTKLEERYDYPDGVGYQTNAWALTWGIGAGVRYAMTDNIGVAFFLDDWVAMRDIIEENVLMGVRRGLFAPSKMTVVGLRSYIAL